MLPPMALLDAPKAEQKIDERELMDAARLLEEKCSEFGVEGAVSQIHPGPVVTTYELKPDAGVKYSKITSLADDLCLAMEAESVLIERIPGKSTVGIQIPNLAREQISLRELLESEAYRQSSSKLTLALGKTITGEPFVSDLATMPHLLIAGSTGTGKSVAMNAMLTSILSRATPEEVPADLDRSETAGVRDVRRHPPSAHNRRRRPQSSRPMRSAGRSRRWKGATRRWRPTAFGISNNSTVTCACSASAHATSTLSEGDPEEVPKPLPYIIVAIDELADLMMIASAEVEEAIARLAQMARAVGIHLILATQRPSVDVITGLIKANLPARISFRVSSKTDSRTILDGNGAEQLLGKGDLLYLPPASSRFIRLHGPYISEQETARLMSFLRKQGQPGYDQSVTSDEKAPNTLEFDKDDLYDRAARLIVSTGQASVSYLQRRLRIGFSRAARLVDMMEAEGLVSQGIGGRPREVLVQQNYFEEVDAQVAVNGRRHRRRSKVED